jgi:pSer/pThr/pTyr-binding forkhead associated (FHA) protein
VQNLRLHFSDLQVPDHPLSGGIHRIVRLEEGGIGIGTATSENWLAQVCLDRGGLWLQVAETTRAVHVNGRPVRRVAWLRAGDAIHIDSTEIVIRTLMCQDVPKLKKTYRYDNDPRLLLRGIGGRYHGRSITLGPERIVGCAADADIRIDSHSCAERHARLQRYRDKVLLQDLGSSDGTIVNGVRVRDAVLSAGDQIVFDPRHRFVVESPVYPEVALPVELGDPFPGLANGRSADREQSRRWPWLLLAAAVSAVILSVLLWFGTA